MKNLRFLLCVALWCAATCVARADIDGFKLDILDPTGGPNLYYINGTGSISFNFGVCPSNNAYAANADGCFTVYNNSRTVFTAFGLSFDNYTSASNPTDYYNYLNSQPVTCDTTPTTTGFTMAPVCGLSKDLSTYNLLFSGGSGFLPGAYFVIAEFGVSQFAFKDTSLTVYPAVASTPEPGTFWLLATGAAVPMGTWWRRRRSATA